MAHLPWHGHANQAKIRSLQHSPAKLAVILQDPTRRPLMQTRRSPAPPLPHLHTNHRCHVAVEHVLYPVLHLGSCTPSVQAPRALPSRLEMTRKRPLTGKISNASLRLCRAHRARSATARAQPFSARAASAAASLKAPPSGGTSRSAG